MVPWTHVSCVRPLMNMILLKDTVFKLLQVPVNVLSLWRGACPEMSLHFFTCPSMTVRDMFLAEQLEIVAHR